METKRNNVVFWIFHNEYAVYSYSAFNLTCSYSFLYILERDMEKACKAEPLLGRAIPDSLLYSHTQHTVITE
jgi:hypothetical protein